MKYLTKHLLITFIFVLIINIEGWDQLLSSFSVDKKWNLEKLHDSALLLPSTAVSVQGAVLHAWFCSFLLLNQRLLCGQIQWAVDSQPLLYNPQPCPLPQMMVLNTEMEDLNEKSCWEGRKHMSVINEYCDPFCRNLSLLKANSCFCTGEQILDSPPLQIK